MSASFYRFLVFAHSGLVLWQNSADPPPPLVDRFVEDIVLGEQRSTNHLSIGEENLDWVFENTFGLVFLVICSKFTNFKPHEFLRLSSTRFVEAFRASLRGLQERFDPAEFGTFDAICRDAFAQAISKSPRAAPQGAPEPAPAPASAPTAGPEPASGLSAPVPADTPADTPAPRNEAAMSKEELLAMLRATAKGANGGRTTRPAKPRAKPSPSPAPTQPRDHDLSVVAGGTGAAPDASLFTPTAPAPRTKGLRSTFKKIMAPIAGGGKIAAEDLDAPMAALCELLQSRNVAADVAVSLCESVKQSLVGLPRGVLTTLRNRATQSLREATTRLLTRHGGGVDIVQLVRESMDAVASGARTEPFKIVFVGVNGAGKSTTLSKVAFRLKQAGITSLVSASDTFRSGAVEQLQKHCRALDIPLFHRGYGKNASQIVRQATAEAMRRDIPCVLVDTAGRMQNNVGLLQGLQKLVAENRPDLVIFVGEALAGNDLVDQILSFDATIRATHPIDGIILSKFDAVGSNTGAAISMIHAAKKPVFFVGVGQKYPDLQPLDPDMVLDALLE